IVPTKSVIIAKAPSNYTLTYPTLNRQHQSIKVLQEHVHAESVRTSGPSWFQGFGSSELEVESSKMGYSVEALLLLQ
ncbi:hypothetical protein PIB30_057822, partial [Stylosanthes scabra]|nr:hypothetical protein [Stylosanthes scabra]